jgi:thiol:disulfide interchange protein
MGVAKEISPMSNCVRLLTFALACWLAAPIGLRAQSQLEPPGFAGLPAVEQTPVTVSAEFTPPAGDKPAELFVTAKIAAGWHIYSITQAPGGPVRTKLTLEDDPAYKLAGDFQSNPAPEKHHESAFNNLLVETHEGKVTWHAPLAITAGTDLTQLKIVGKAQVQACTENNCLPPKRLSFEASLAKAGRYTHPASHAIIEGWVEPATITPGGTAIVHLMATPTDGYHIYALSAHPAERGPKPTLIQWIETDGLRPLPPVAHAEPIEKPGDAAGDPPVLLYKTPVEWTVELDVPAVPAKATGTKQLEGVVGYMTCLANGSCDLPRAARFTAELPIGATVTSGRVPLVFHDARYVEAAALATKPNSAANATGPSSGAGTEISALPWMIVSALLGGLILNLMPCVLPVIGLKIFSFVEQAGESRRVALLLNLWYTAGVLVVFMVLATLASAANLGLAESGLAWGQQFSSTTFNIIMSSIVFVMALSFLGVWEIPIPGFVGSGKANDLASREGPLGAFTKGAITTILATPCSGPFLGPVFGFTLTEPPLVTYLIFGCIGLGMSLPYLVIGAFPKMIRFLPKPGGWMTTFKQVMGFVMLGAVVFLFTFLKTDYVVPTFGLLIGLWAGCWWIGRTALYEGAAKIAKAYAIGGVIAGLVGLFAFTVLLPGESLLPWQPFSRPALAELREKRKTVLVDFTADWCLTCKANLKFAINRREVSDLVQKQGVVPLLADMTDVASENWSVLNSLGGNSIPFLAVFPADRPDEPIVLRDLVTKSQVLDALQRAGPSQAPADEKITALERP